MKSRSKSKLFIVGFSSYVNSHDDVDFNFNFSTTSSYTRAREKNNDSLDSRT